MWMDDGRDDGGTKGGAVIRKSGQHEAGRGRVCRQGDIEDRESDVEILQRGRPEHDFDALGRVTGSTGLASGSRSYTYDCDGNRLTKTEGRSTYTSTYDRTDQLINVTKTGGSAQCPASRFLDTFALIGCDPSESAR